ncbi:MAG: asparagine synthase (glutamine-hydrolyzing) [Candidatus Neomarinimicrobiota bacterium]
MCGIFGLVVNKNQTINNKKKSLDEALNLLSHRGPDQSGIYFNEQVYLGHQRLSIIDPENGKQPMISNDGRYIISFNGEIFNYKKIRELLKKKGYSFKTNSDTEVIISAFDFFGFDCLQYFNGMFSFAIWDTLKKQLFLARDRFGMKPLFFSMQKNLIIFSSEIKSLYKSDIIDFNPRYENFNEFLIFGYIAGEETLHENIKELEPGHYFTWRNNNYCKKQYWSPKSNNILLNYSIYDALDKLENAVNTWLTSDVEVASLLSGGIDSNILAAIADKSLNGVTTFGGSLDNDKKNNEESLIKIASKNLRGKHYSIKIKDQFLIDNFCNLIKHFDDPIHDSNYFSLMAICSSIKKNTNIKVALCGEGADEIFGGYERYKFFSKHFNYKSIDNLIYSYNHVAIPRLRLLTKDPVIISQKRYDIFQEVISDDIFNTLLLYDQKTFLGSYLHRQDRVGMMFGLEIRTPYLDHRLVKFVNSIPSKNKYNSQYLKLILRLAGDKLVDQRIIWNQQKIAFSFPTSNLLENGFLKILFQKNFKKGFLLENFYDINGISTLLNEQSKGIDHSNTLWRIICLEYWLRTMANNQN